MGDRALAACHLQADLFALYRSHWAGSEKQIDAILQNQWATPLVDCEWEFVDSRRWPALVSSIDYLSLDTVYCVAPVGVFVLVPLWFGFPTADGPKTESTCGALVRINSLAELRRLRRRFRGEKAVLSEGISQTPLENSRARDRLLTMLDGHEYYPSPSLVADIRWASVRV